jgi:predicted small lipoprotein YifL
LLLLAALILLGGCGQKGPLYLPDEDQQEEN